MWVKAVFVDFIDLINFPNNEKNAPLSRSYYANLLI